MIVLATNAVSLITMGQRNIQRVQHDPAHREEEHQLVLSLQGQQVLVVESVDKDAQGEQDEPVHHH